jgi:hypothetical protein
VPKFVCLRFALGWRYIASMHLNFDRRLVCLKQSHCSNAALHTRHPQCLIPLSTAVALKAAMVERRAPWVWGTMQTNASHYRARLNWSQASGSATAEQVCVCLILQCVFAAFKRCRKSTFLCLLYFDGCKCWSSECSSLTSSFC